MSRLEKLKEALKNPPPERLARIEYRSHALQAIGITFVCGMLIFKGFWYIIFALIFGVGISYSQGMSAYQKYKMIKKYIGEEKPEDYQHDESWTRKRSKIVNYIVGGWGGWISAILAVATSYLLLGVDMNRWMLMLFYMFYTISIYIIYYFFIVYPLANIFYKRKIEGGKK